MWSACPCRDRGRKALVVALPFRLVAASHRLSDPVIVCAKPEGIVTATSKRDSLIAFAAVVGGSDGWSQNPEGLSIGDGRKLLVELAEVEAAPVRRSLPAGPRHNEVRTVSVDGARIRYGGHEDGPSMHTGDADHALIRATGVIGTVAE